MLPPQWSLPKEPVELGSLLFRLPPALPLLLLAQLQAAPPVFLSILNPLLSPPR